MNILAIVHIHIDLPQRSAVFYRTRTLQPLGQLQPSPTRIGGEDNLIDSRNLSPRLDLEPDDFGIEPFGPF